MSEEKKKLLILAGIIVGAVVVIIIGLLIFHAITNNKPSYDGIEKKVLTAAKKYYKANETLLPDNGQQISIDDSALTAAGYLKSMSELTSKLNATCTAKVVVTNKEGKYRYTALLDCGEKYSSKTFAEYLKTKVGTVTTGQGLYEMNGELVFRGETPNNYVRFSGKMYRIVKVTDNNVVLIYNEKVGRGTWDNRFNNARNNNDGINDYAVSRISESLNNLTIVKDEFKELLQPHTLYIGKRAQSDMYNDGSIEKSNILENQTYGLLPLYDYINASLDSNCVSAATNSCANYNYLNKYDYNWWTLTADMESTHKVYRIDFSGKVDLLRAASGGYIRPVIYLVSDVLYASGNGTAKNPYIVK